MSRCAATTGALLLLVIVSGLVPVNSRLMDWFQQQGSSVAAAVGHFDADDSEARPLSRGAKGIRDTVSLTADTRVPAISARIPDSSNCKSVLWGSY